MPVPLSAPANDLTVDGLQARIKKLGENKDLDSAIKSKAADAYGRALDLLREATDSAARSEQYLKLMREAPETLQTLKATLAKPAAVQPPMVPGDATLPQLQQLLSQSEQNLSEAQKVLQSLQDEPKRRADRRLEIPKLADAAKLQLQEIDRLLDAKTAAEEPMEVMTAMRLLLEARKKALAAEASASQAELQLFEATGEALSAQRDLAARRVAQAESQVKALQALVNERRRQEAERQAREAQRTSVQAQPAVRNIALTNAELAGVRQSLATEIESTTRELERIDLQVTTLEEQFKKITKRYDTAGATEAIGLLLRKQRDELPNAGVHQRNIKQRAVEISNTYLELIDYEERRNELARIDQREKEIVSGLGTSIQGDARDVLEEEVRGLLEAQRSVIDSLIADTNSFLDKVVELDVRERQLIAKAGEFAKYCDERILWIRSATMFDSANLRQLVLSLTWLTNPNNWYEVSKVLGADIRTHPALAALAALVLLVLIVLQRPLRKRTTLLGKQAARSNITSYLPTLHVMLTTCLLALLWPSLVRYVGTRLVASDSGLEFVVAMGRGLKSTAIVFGTIELLRQVCRRGGLAEAHFDWSEETTRVVRETAWWFMVGGLPCIFIVIATEAQPSELIKNSLGRLAFIGCLTVLTVCVHRIMRPAGGVLDRVYAVAPQAWTSRMMTGWYLLALSAPIALGLLAFGGYYYTALQLAWRLLATVWLAIGLLIVHAALIRWSLLSYRDLAMRQARERRAAAEAVGSSSTSPAGVANIQPVVKLSDINKQTRKSLQLGTAIGLVAGLWLIWINVLPALGALRHVELWMVETNSTSGTTVTTVLQPITLANVLLAVVVASLTFTASRNLPSLLEIAVLQRLPLDPGVRYAIATVCRYTITSAGLVAAFGTIGIGWSKVQWLVAAVSVGLGFGLQEIFANFVSGLILLVERPVRLGDIVTVGDVTGHVTRIQMRATTITDWDMRELVVPNKEFITGRVMNWTLSSTASRMSIEVGVEYGTDPDLVRNLLLQIATRHPLVSKELPPHALFDDFGPSTLKFVLRVYMDSRDVYLDLRHELLSEIAREFNQAGIVFAFPQRDIRIRSFESPVSPKVPSGEIERPQGAASRNGHRTADIPSGGNLR